MHDVYKGNQRLVIYCLETRGWMPCVSTTT